MVKAEDSNPEKPAGASTRTAVLATVGIAVILGLALFIVVWVVPVWHAHSALCSHLRGDIGENEVVGQLGGQTRACRKLSLYLRCPDCVAKKKYMAAYLLQHCGDDGVPALRKALHDDEWFVRRCAALALGEIGPGARAAEPELGRALRDPEPGVRVHAVWALGQLGRCSRAWWPDLVECLKDADSDVRLRAAEALAKVGAGGMEVEAGLVKLKEDENELVRQAAAQALKRIRGPE